MLKKEIAVASLSLLLLGGCRSRREQVSEAVIEKRSDSVEKMSAVTVEERLSIAELELDDVELWLPDDSAAECSRRVRIAKVTARTRREVAATAAAKSVKQERDSTQARVMTVDNREVPSPRGRRLLNWMLAAVAGALMMLIVKNKFKK